MFIKQNLQNYRKGMKAYDKCHPPTIASQWKAFYGELEEFIETPNELERCTLLNLNFFTFW